MLNQKKICTSTGVPRKNQIYGQLTHDITGFGDSRITARMAPSTTPTSMASAVNSRVRRMPRKMSPLKRNFSTTSQPVCGPRPVRSFPIAVPIV